MHRVVPFDLECGRELHRVNLLGEEQIMGAGKMRADKETA
jgi:hypothetical protein